MRTSPPPDATGLQPAEMLRAMPFSMAYRHSWCLFNRRPPGAEHRHWLT